jgi:hypothetical protein
MRLPAKYRNSFQVGREERGGWRLSSGPGTGTGNAANSCAKNREHQYTGHKGHLFSEQGHRVRGHKGHLFSEQGRKVGQGRGQEDKGKLEK